MFSNPHTPPAEQGEYPREIPADRLREIVDNGEERALRDHIDRRYEEIERDYYDCAPMRDSLLRELDWIEMDLDAITGGSRG